MKPTVAPLADVRAEALALWERSVTRTPFTHPAFAEAAGEAFGLRPLALLAASGEAGVIGLEKQRGPLRALALAPMAPEAPPLLAALPEASGVHGRETDLDALVAALGERYAQATLALGADWPDARPFAWAGWDVGARYTYRLALDAESSDRWSKTTRWTARKHADAYVIEWGAEHVARAAALEVASYERKDAPFGLAPEAIAAVAGALVDAGLARAAAARNVQTGEVEAAAVFAHAGTTAWYWVAGSVPGPAMTVLLGDAVAELASGGLTTLDWAGANVPGVAEFKRKMADALVPTLTVRRVGPRWLRALDALR